MSSVLSGINAAIQTALGIAGVTSQIVSNAQVNNNNTTITNLQQQLAVQQIESQKEQIEAYTKLNDPLTRYARAVQAGFGNDAASQFAGRSAPHIVGAVSVGPMLQRTQDAIHWQNPGQGFAHGSPRKTVSRTQLTHDWLAGIDRLSSSRPRRLSTTSSVWSNSTNSTRLSSSTGASSTSTMLVSDSRPIVFNKGKTQATWVPGSNA